MHLSELLNPWFQQLDNDCLITGIKNDSRAVQPGNLFLAYPGALVDGRRFILQAQQAGASAILYEEAGCDASFIVDSCICLPIASLEEKMADIASRFYGEPTKSLCFTGVTGTNGKTTIAYQLAQAYDLLGQSAAYIGTLGQGKPFALKPLNNTTPDALILQTLFKDYVSQGVQQISMEVSSHALSQHRVAHIPFQQAIFTNLTHDHLDYHHTMEAYAEAKSLLFATPGLRCAIINQDSDYAQQMKSKVASTCEVLTYGIRQPADVQAISCKVTLEGSRLHLKSPWGEYHLCIKALGYFNVYNALAIFTSLAAAGYSPEKLVLMMEKLRAAPGRMEVVAQKPTVLVDYAHTPDALQNVLVTLTELKVGRLIVVFGCGGDRDRLKRPVMGKIASEYADLVLLTSDNPRHEDPEQILTDIEAGIPSARCFERITDRKTAIKRALELANANDIVVIAGKGDESYQQIGDEKFPFSDRDVVNGKS